MLNNKSKINIPDRIKIGPYDVKVEVVDNIAIDREHGGEYSPRELKISLDRSLKERHGEILVHEVIESIDDIYDLNIDHHAITILGVALYQVLRENMLIFSPLQEGGLITSREAIIGE